MATSTEWWLTDLPTNYFLVPVCQWFVSCIGVAAREKWHGSCYHATEWYAYVFASAWSLLAWSTGAKDLPRKHEWFWCPCSPHLTNRIIYWRHGVFLWFCIIQVLKRPVLVSMMVLSILCGSVGKQRGELAAYSKEMKFVNRDKLDIVRNVCHVWLCLTIWWRMQALIKPLHQ